MAFKKPKVTKKEVSQRFNLKEIFGKDFSSNPALRDAIGQAFIDKIIERTADGKQIGGRRDLKKPYSDAYASSSEFKDMGKSKNDVNMELTGRTLDSVDLTQSRGNTIKIEITDEQRIPAAYNNITGDKNPKRPWFGLRKYEINEIKKEFRDELRSLPSDKKETSATEEITTIASLLNESQDVDFGAVIIEGFNLGEGEDI